MAELVRSDMYPILSVPFVDESSLVAAISDSATLSRRWVERAACATELPSGVDTYFPEEGHLPPIDALALCLSCPVAIECLATALVDESESGDRFGWWGGLGPEEREELALRLGIAALPVEVDSRRPADLARFLRSKNLTIAAIAAELGCNERTVYRYLADWAA
jgi:hypothetical protein